VINAMGIKPHPLLAFSRLLLEENAINLKQLIEILNTSKHISPSFSLILG
jgi:hypothetical protein